MLLDTFQGPKFKCPGRDLITNSLLSPEVSFGVRKASLRISEVAHEYNTKSETPSDCKKVETRNVHSKSLCSWIILDISMKAMHQLYSEK